MRSHRQISRLAATIATAALLVLLSAAALAVSASAGTGGATPDASDGDEGTRERTTRARKAKIRGRIAIPPRSAPKRVKDVIRWANRITRKPYRYGGGHARFRDSGYDCSGAVSYLLRGGRFIDHPVDATGFFNWGKKGRGKWITVYANNGHSFIVVAGRRFDTTPYGSGARGPRWRKTKRPTGSFKKRHPAGY